MIKLGSHVGMSGKKMMLGSVEEALSYGANTFMIYTGAPQNTRRKEIKDLNIEAAQALMKENGIDEFIVHAPYIINLANTVNPDTYQLAVDFLRLELTRAAAMGSKVLVLHPGAHVGAGVEAGIASIVKGLNEVLTDDTDCLIALETMAGKGTEIGRTFEELAQIYDGVQKKDRLRVCFDTCHTHDSGYDIIHDFDGVIEQFDRILGKDQIAAFHINDSKNICGASKDRHENLGVGHIGFDALHHIVHHPDFTQMPKILETPWIPIDGDKKNTRAPYKEEISLLLR
ncbi:MAG: deoxyribonuclease IV [Lachnospiraceae bacterium]|nr:deoxyribonuclease IV [Lachnospiraceae bacterium]